MTRAVRRTLPYHALWPLHSFARAIVATRPDLILSGDDLATLHLQSLHRWLKNRGEQGREICALIERSLGSPENFPIMSARSQFIEIACSEGVRVPRTEIVENQEQLKHWIVQMGFPLVLKADGTSGGYGVRVVHTPEEAEAGFRSLHSRPSRLRAVKHALIDRDATLVRSAVVGRRPVVNVQAFVAGREATSTVACWRGSILAMLNFEVVEKRHAAGHATVLRLVENVEISTAVAKLVRRLNLSGVHGFDFMVETQTGAAALIEMNPRITQVGHLSLGEGRDIPAALRAVLADAPIELAPKVTECDTIALFPQEWVRDPESPFLRSAYHDVPWDEPDLISHCIKNCGRQRSWYQKQNNGVMSTLHSSSIIASPLPSSPNGLKWDAKKTQYD
jgi:hypothetical protein